MNYKRLPDNAYKLIAIALSIILSVNLVFCFIPSVFSADLPDIIPYDNYLQDYDTRLKNIQDGALRRILDDPNLTDQEKAHHVLPYALQLFDYRLAFEAPKRKSAGRKKFDLISIKTVLS